MSKNNFLKKSGVMQKIEWFDLASCYLEAANLLIEEILEPKHRENYCNESQEEMSKQNAVIYFIPLKYNLQHSIELFIKSIFISLVIEQSEFNNNHDIGSLLLKLNDCCNGIMRFSQSKEFADFKKLATKYSYFIELNNNGTSSTVDKKNMLNRYADGKDSDGKDINYFDNMYNIDDRSIEILLEIKEDIRSLQHIYLEIQDFQK